VRPHISIAAFVSEGERAAIHLAAGHIARSLSLAAGVPWTCDCVFSPDKETLRKGTDAVIIVTSFLAELAKIGTPWPQAEQRLRTDCAKLTESGTPVFICTILRHVEAGEGPEAAIALRIHIRRLNLLATQISQETGAYVIDLDRVLADIGARRLQTDYRLGGNAAEISGHFIALTLVNSACEAFVSDEIQSAAGEIIHSWRPAIAIPNSAKPEVIIRKNYLTMGRGHRKQIVSPAAYTVPEDYVGWLVWQALRGAIEPREVFRRMVEAIRKRGVRKSLRLVTTGLSRQVFRRK
jgi:hypothetical protein